MKDLYDIAADIYAEWAAARIAQGMTDTSEAGRSARLSIGLAKEFVRAAKADTQAARQSPLARDPEP